mmetsp:Transcript_9733/g.20658  ORF Transcript_9733/g.20658 Transcript_9733/m.20658 type:complete len:303 (-) Transcript_9733:79-987(-)
MTMTSPECNNNINPLCWACDSNNDELDPQLKAAHRVAVRDDADPPCRSWSEAERTEPLILRSLLSGEQIDEILAQASAEGVWPRGSRDYNTGDEIIDRDDDALIMSPPLCRRHRLADACVDVVVQPPSISSDKIRNHFNRPGLCDELRSAAHHLAWTDEHVVLYMHTDNWFVRTLPEYWSLIRGAMESRPWMNGAVPVMDDSWVESEQSMENVRCIELHHYSAGGGLLTPGHRDCGSALTISVLLSDPSDVTGGDFVTYDEGTPVAHKMGRGDAILFSSEKLHNISTVTSGLRQSLVVELWP